MIARVCGGLIVVLALGMLGAAQTPPAQTPALSEVDQLKLQAIELEAEVHRLRIQVSAAALAQLEAESKTFVKSLAVPGYRIERGPDGKWRYVAVKP